MLLPFNSTYTPIMNPPSALAFGPEERIPTASNLRLLKDVLQDDPTFAGITACLKQLPDTWKALLHQDAQLQSLASERRAAVLSNSLLNDEQHEGDMDTNQVIMPMTVLVHMVQYRQFLQQSSPSSHATVMQSVAAGGVQGFCAGLLSAFAVCSMTNEDDFDACATYAIKLAMCVGAYVDLAMESEKGDMASAIVRWSIPDGRNRVNKAVGRYQSVCSLPGFS